MGASLEQVVAELVERARSLFFGKYSGTVVDNADPEGMGRLRVSVPAVFGSGQSPAWALPCAPYAGPDQGFFALPPVGAAVWVEFEAGDPDHPIWSGGWWPRRDRPEPQEGSAGEAGTKVLKTASGLNIALDDDGETLAISDGRGSNVLTLRARQGRIEIEAAAKVVVNAPQIELVDGAPHPLAFGDELMSYLAQLVAAFNSHTHPGETLVGIPVTPAPPVPPQTPPTPALISTRVKTG